MAVIAAFADLRGAIGFSSFAVLIYYAIANASAWLQPPTNDVGPDQSKPSELPAAALLAFSLPVTSIVPGALVLVIGSAIWLIRNRVNPRND